MLPLLEGGRAVGDVDRPSIRSERTSEVGATSPFPDAPAPAAPSPAQAPSPTPPLLPSPVPPSPTSQPPISVEPESGSPAGADAPGIVGPPPETRPMPWNAAGLWVRVVRNPDPPWDDCRPAGPRVGAPVPHRGLPLGVGRPAYESRAGGYARSRPRLPRSPRLLHRERRAEYKFSGTMARVRSGTRAHSDSWTSSVH
jgi:hypothetical protein